YYDAVGNRTQIRYPSGTLVCRCFDPLDRIKQIRADGSPVASYTYSGSYLVHRRSYPNNTFTHYRYDKNRRCILVAHTSSPQISQNTPITIAGFAYRFDAEDNRLYEARIAAVSEYNHQLTATFSRLRFFTYDDNYRITATLYRVTNLAEFESAFNNQSPPPQPRSWAEAETFKNDGVYNIPEYTDILGNVWTRTVNNMNQYTQIKKNDQPVAELQYDACGNLTFDSERSFSYDYKNRLREVYISDRLVARYLYDAKDRRIAKIIYDESGKVERIILFVYDGWQVVEEYKIQSSAEREATLQDKPRLAADYVYGLGIDEPLRMRRDLNDDGYFNSVSETFFYYENGIGSIYALADGAGNVVERYDYTTYGEVRVYAADGVTEREESLVGNVYGFQGRRIDWETATATQSPLYYFRHRIYSPTLQRFLQPDPLNGTSYCAHNNAPTNWRDVMGLQREGEPRNNEEKEYEKLEDKRVKLQEQLKTVIRETARWIRIIAGTKREINELQKEVNKAKEKAEKNRRAGVGLQEATEKDVLLRLDHQRSWLLCARDRLRELIRKQIDIQRSLSALDKEERGFSDYVRLGGYIQTMKKRGFRFAYGWPPLGAQLVNPWNRKAEQRVDERLFILRLGWFRQIAVSWVEAHKSGGPSRVDFPTAEVRQACEKVWLPSAGVTQAALQKECVEMMGELLHLALCGETFHGKKWDIVVRCWAKEGTIYVQVYGPKFVARKGALVVLPEQPLEPKEAISALFYRYALERGMVPRWLLTLAEQLGVKLRKRGRRK
ncbi:MAG: hypothetical protein DRP82_00305, partial [Planctomycetota bacterium]